MNISAAVAFYQLPVRYLFTFHAPSFPLWPLLIGFFFLKKIGIQSFFFHFLHSLTCFEVCTFWHLSVLLNNYYLENYLSNGYKSLKLYSISELLIAKKTDYSSPFCEANDTPVLDYWWCLPRVSKPGWILLLVCFLPCSPLVRHSMPFCLFLRFYP